MSEDWSFADAYAMDVETASAESDLTDVKGEEWRNILVLGRATGRVVYHETLALVGHARYLADQLGCRVEVLLIGTDIDAAVEDVKRYAVDNIYTVKAPDYAPIQHTAKVLAEVVHKRRPELVLVFQSRSGDAITAYAASLLGAGFVIGATQVDIDTSERLAVCTHPGADHRFRIRTQMLATPQFVSVQRGLFRAPLEDPYHTTRVHALDVEADPVADVEVLERHPPPQETIETADRVVVAGGRIRSKEDLAAARELAERIGAVFGVTQGIVDRGLAEDAPVVGELDHKTAPRLFVAVGCQGALDLMEAIPRGTTVVALASGEGDPINERAAYHVAGTAKEAVDAVLKAL